MNNNSKNPSQILKLFFFCFGEVFAVFSIIVFAIRGPWTRTAWAVLSVFMLLIPMLSERILRQKLSPQIYILGLLYSLGPSLGHTYNLYNLFPWWDELLHFTGGIVFALLGFEIARKMNRDKNASSNLWITALFGVFFSITLSVLWEFAEYGIDLVFGLDMQCDTVINYISSYKLGAEQGITGSITDINEVIVNGQPLNIGGYLDIGLHDTMTDLLSEALGAVISMIIFVVRKGRFGLFDKKAITR